ncbi:hypothetical protein CcCBS67573_g02326 [Chytriomyces confervae]|uniref:MARVEL domain-containing protein n=1 Tax=Chytriomyces confervae TaxID=246404 RepID=A0A507FL64_9FUNG|nr:hypothetical protein CcCBS67573_g02326 [Chytriomyces confervae]
MSRSKGGTGNLTLDDSTGDRSKKNGIRSSIDLELQLGFEQNPKDKPSSDFRDADKWFTQARETAENETAAEIAKPDRASVRSSFARFASGFGLGRNSRILTDAESRMSIPPHQLAQDSNVYRESGLSDTYHAPLPSATSPHRRPLGPRFEGVTTSRSSKSLDSDPIHMFLQLRIWICIAVMLGSLTASGVMATLTSSQVSPSRASTQFFIFTGSVSVLVAFAEVVFFLILGDKMLYHYDAPFLLLMSNNSTPTSRVLSKRDLFLPFANLAVHGCLLLFWLATLADIGSKIGSCRSVALTLRVSTATCTGFEAVIGLGVAVMVAEVFSTGMKGWEVFSNWNSIRKAMVQ